MELIDPLKSSRRLAAQKNATKVRLQPFNHVERSVHIFNKWEDHLLQKNLQMMQKEGKLVKENLDREKKHFVYTSRNKLKKTIPAAKHEGDTAKGGNDDATVFDSDLLRIVQFYEQKNPNGIKHSSSENDVRKLHFKKPAPKPAGVKLEPLDKHLSTSLADMSSKPQFKPRSKRHVPLKGSMASKLYSVNSVPKDGHADDEKEELRRRHTGVISCPAFYLETGQSSMSRASPFNVHSSLDRPLYESDDEPGGIVSVMVNNYQSRSTSRTTNRYETPTPVVPGDKNGRDSKLSNDMPLIQEDRKGAYFKGFTNGQRSISPMKGGWGSHGKSTFPEGGELSAVTSSSTETGYRHKGVLQGRSLLQSQSSETDTCGTLSTDNTPVNTPKGVAYLTSINRTPSHNLRHNFKRKPNSTLTSTKVYQSKPSTEPSLGVQEILDKHMHPVLPQSQGVLPKIPAQHSSAEDVGRTNLQKGEGHHMSDDMRKSGHLDKGKATRNKNNSKYYKNDKLVTSFLIPSDVKKSCAGASFDPYVLALDPQEIEDIENVKRNDVTGQRLDGERRVYRTAQGNAQNWITEMDQQKKKDKLKYITNF